MQPSPQPLIACAFVACALNRRIHPYTPALENALLLKRSLVQHSRLAPESRRSRNGSGNQWRNSRITSAGLSRVDRLPGCSGSIARNNNVTCRFAVFQPSSVLNRAVAFFDRKSRCEAGQNRRNRRQMASCANTCEQNNVVPRPSVGNF
jgi:hypothetical protein